MDLHGFPTTTGQLCELLAVTAAQNLSESMLLHSIPIDAYVYIDTDLYMIYRFYVEVPHCCFPVFVLVL